MILSLFQRRPPPSEVAAEPIYAAIVAQARQPVFYRDLGVPDTTPGRFEMIVLHAALYFRRLKDADAASKDISQSVFDLMFRDMDRSMREMGVGDLAVPKRIKAMARSFYDGVATYEAALAKPEDAELTSALTRIVYAGSVPVAAAPERLAAYVRLAAEALAAQPEAQLVSGGPDYPPADETVLKASVETVR